MHSRRPLLAFGAWEISRTASRVRVRRVLGLEGAREIVAREFFDFSAQLSWRGNGSPVLVQAVYLGPEVERARLMSIVKRGVPI